MKDEKFDKKDPKYNGKEGKQGSKGKKGNGKGGKPYKDPTPPKQDKENTTTEWQDPFWYAHSAQALKDVANFPFGERLGDPFPLGNRYYRVPGICQYRFLPALGYMHGKDNDAHRSAVAYFETLTQGFAGFADIQASDLQMLMLAVENVFMLIIEGKRAYGLLRKFKQFNMYLAERLVEAVGFNFEDLSSNMADFRSSLNIIIKQVNNTLAIPKGYFIGDRWEFLVSNVFTDTPDEERQQFSVFVPQNYWLLDETSMLTGTCLRWRDTILSTSRTRYTRAEYFRVLNELIAALTNNKEWSNTFGSIRRVYDADKLKTVSELEEGFEVEPAYHHVMQEQMHNATWFSPSYISFGVPVKFQDPEQPDNSKYYDSLVPVYQGANGEILSTPFIKKTLGDHNPVMWDRKLIDVMRATAPTPEVTIDATALITAKGSTQFAATDTDTPSLIEFIPRTEIIVAVEMYLNNTTWGVTQSQTSLIPVTSMALSNFDYHPILYSFSGTTDVAMMGELTMYTTVSNYDIRKMNERSFYSLLNAPVGNKSVTD